MYNYQQIRSALFEVVYNEGECSNSQGDIIITQVLKRLEELN